MANNRSIATTVLLVLMIAVVVVSGVSLWARLRTDEVQSIAERGEAVGTLLVVHDDDRVHLSVILMTHGLNGRAALLDVPPATGAVIAERGVVDRLESVFDPDDPAAYRRHIELLLDTEIAYDIRFDLRRFADFIDLAGGLPVFVVDESSDDATQRFPAGNAVLDGAKAVEYLLTAAAGEPDAELTARRQSVSFGVLRALASHQEFLRHPEVRPIRAKLVRTDLSQRGLDSLLQQLGSIDRSDVIRRRVQGQVRTVEVESVSRSVLFPHFQGRWARQSARQVEELLLDSDTELAIGSVVRVEVLNGTPTAGLARRTSEQLEDYGFVVQRYANAESSDVEFTRVVNRSGIPEHAQQIANVMRAERIVTELRPDSDVDITLVLGRDFDGTVVRADE